MELNLNDIVKMKKKHPCGEDRFLIIRTGMDVKAKCLKCGRIIMLPYEDFVKKVKKVLSNE
ncbi:MAG: DUF951 domain-containing protein [Eubacteriales bacterium]